MCKLAGVASCDRGDGCPKKEKEEKKTGSSKIVQEMLADLA